MTAIVAILNKTTVSLAADSAATITSSQGQKVYNHANKLFNLSAYQPVGLMIYNSADLVGIPWETIVKMYRRELGSQHFGSIPEYAEHFLKYIERFKDKIDTIDAQARVNSIANDFCNLLWKDVERKINANHNFGSLTDIEKQSFVNESIIIEILPDSLQAFANMPIPAELTGYDSTAFETEYGQLLKPFLTSLLDEKYGFHPTSEALDSITLLIYESGIRFTELGPWSGLVFAGFGTDDIYPHLTSSRIGPIFGGAFRIIKDAEVKISSQHPADIVPYAQSDVILSFITGIDPTFKESVEGAVNDTLNAVIGDVLPLLNIEQRTQVQQRKQDAIQAFKDSINNIQRLTHTGPIIDTVAGLSKEDVADMAESLISLTYLKRRVSFVLESVGGPVDVAVITKGEGFIWLKRKQYFKPELNLNYLSSVLNKPLPNITTHVPDQPENDA